MENIDVLDRIITWPLPKSSPVDIKIENINWEWLLQFNEWVICNKSTIYDEKGWRDYIKYKEDEKCSLMSEPVPHIFDVINYWPQAHRQCLGTKDLPEGWMWQWIGDDWVLSNGTIGLLRADWFKYNDKQVAAQGATATKEEVMALIDMWPTNDWSYVGKEVTKGWIWVGLSGRIVVISQVDNINDGITITENDWREYRTPPVPSVQTVTAASMLQAALGHMEDRAKTYDTPGGERSMGKTVAAFNIITGNNLTEESGWLFMEILKQVRSQQGNYRSDSYEDLVAYAALRGECAARERGDK